MAALVIGHARTSRLEAEADAQRDALLTAGCDPQRLYLDHGLVGMSRPRPALGEAMATVRAGDTLVVTALARLARSVPDAHQLLSRLLSQELTVQVGDTTYLPDDPAGQMLLQGLGLTADLHATLSSASTRQGPTAARPRAAARPPAEADPRPGTADRHASYTGYYSVADVGDPMNVSRSTVYRALRRAAERDARDRGAASQP